MKKILLLLFVCIAAYGNAQQKELDSLLNELKKHPQEDTVRLNLLNKVAYEYNVSNSAEGIKMSDSAIQLAGKLNDKKGLAIGLLNKGINNGSLKNDSLTLQFYNQALKIAQHSDLKPLIMQVYHDIGIYYFDKSDHPQAMAFQNKSLAMAIAAHDSSQMGNDYMAIGTIYQRLSVYSEAINYQLKALKIFNRINNQNKVANVYNNLGLNYIHLEQFQKALDYHKKAFEMHKYSEDRQGMANSLANEANVYDNLNDSARALQLYHQALAISEEIKYQSGVINNTANIGILYTYYSDYYKAMPYLLKTLALYEKSNDKYNQTLILNRLADVCNNASIKDLLRLKISPRNRYTTALIYNNRALLLAKEEKAVTKQANALEGISKTYEKEKDYKKALDYYKESEKMNDSLTNDKKNNKEITRLEIQYNFDRQKDSVRAINDKQQALAKAEIQKQKVIENAMMTGVGFLILTGICGFVFYKRNRDIRTQKNEAELQTQITDTEMKALRAQMNPHFIFNSLNSIADYIDKNQTKLAADFTAKFAMLMRMVLENSEQKEIPLADDLKSLELYMKLESYRLQNKFDYNIEVDETIDKENTLVPPLILQPFVENSIWHGIAKKEGKGHITIYIHQEGDMLNCIVEDDGDGIKETTAMQERKSVGMKITKARIDVINKLKNAGASMNVSNKRNGVRAEVRLPLELSF